ncbi:hypothetical protein BD560DRAFT_424720 [Blakeslea trispora]|nr:hypothetical protein BD560DRAFT_424720 [Blakeslea trispora]
MSSRKSMLERRSQYPLHERLIMYNAEAIQKRIDNTHSETVVTGPLKVNGVNLLNRDSIDTHTVMKRIIKKRQTHSRIERRRRDRLNNLFRELSSTLPNMKHKTDNHRSEILQEAISYIKEIQKTSHSNIDHRITLSREMPITQLTPNDLVQRSTKHSPAPLPQSYFESTICFK